MLFLLVSLVASLAAFADAGQSCASLTAGKNLPCVEVHSCASGAEAGQITINQLSNGLGQAKSSSTARLCYTADNLRVEVTSSTQKYFPSKDQFSKCNDPVFNVDVVELFIAPVGSEDPHWYSEIDTSPYDVIFESGIYNPNLNHSGVSNYLIDCSTSHVAHTTSVNETGKAWTWTVQVPWKLVNHPEGKDSLSDSASKVSAGSVFRANMYRVNELTPVASSCSSSSCEYMAWSPTLSNPPAFHEPTKFGYFLLV